MTTVCFVRWCRSHRSLLTIADELQQSVGVSTQDINAQIGRLVFNEDEINCPRNVEISLYRADDRSPTSLGHCIGVVAVTIALPLYEARGQLVEIAPSSRHRKDARTRKGATLLLDEERSKDRVDIVATPSGCTTIFAAATFHHDLRYRSAKCLLHAIVFASEELRFDDALTEIGPKAPSQPFVQQAKLASNFYRTPRSEYLVGDRLEHL